MDITFYMFFSAFLMSMSAWCIFLWRCAPGSFGMLKRANIKSGRRTAMKITPHRKPRGNKS